MKATHHPAGIPGSSGKLQRAAGIILLAALFGTAAARADTAALTNAITAKESEIRWKKEDIQKAAREVHAFSAFIANHDETSGQLESASSELERLDAKLATIQQNNLVKLTIRTAFDTYKSINLGSGVGKAAAEKMISTGFTAALAAGGREFVKDKMEDQAKAAIGVDDNTLLGPRTVKLRGVNAKAREVFPELDRVNRTLALSLEAIQSQAWKEEGEELGEVGAILRKNIVVREVITTARQKLGELSVEGERALAEAEANLPAAEAALGELTDELSALESELASLKQQLQEELLAEQTAATQALITPARDLQPPAVDVDRLEDEDGPGILRALAGGPRGCRPCGLGGRKSGGHRGDQ